MQGIFVGNFRVGGEGCDGNLSNYSIIEPLWNLFVQLFNN